MRRRRLIGLAALATVFSGCTAYFLFWPTGLEPEAWDPPEAADWPTASGGGLEGPRPTAWVTAETAALTTGRPGKAPTIAVPVLTALFSVVTSTSPNSSFGVWRVPVAVTVRRSRRPAANHPPPKPLPPLSPSSA